MTPSARIQSAIEILEQLESTALPADRFIRNWFASRRYAGSKDRAAVANRVYDVLRHRASYAWRMRNEVPRALVIASLLSENAPNIDALFDGAHYGPPGLTDRERDAIANPPPEDPPLHVRGEFPVWLEPELTLAFGTGLLDEMQAMAARAPVDLRVNTLRAARDDMLTGLRGLGFEAQPAPHAPHGIRLPSAEGLSALQQTSFFQTGAVEIQDASSQIAAALCGARPGMRVLDLAAGAGGKSLALAADMQNRGEILACDTDAKRLAQLAPRARRAGASIIRPLLLSEAAPEGTFDLVLVDAPCSGSGAWRRNPDAKWRLTPERLQALARLQADLLDRAAQFTAPGGRLVYATCSLLPRENQDQVAGCLTRKRGFRIENAAARWRAVVGTVPPPGMENRFRASPLTTGTDGFFACVLIRE